MWRTPHPQVNKLATASGCTPAFNSASNHAFHHASNQVLSEIKRAQAAIVYIAFLIHQFWVQC